MADEFIPKVRSNTLQKRLLSDTEKCLFTDVTFRVGPEGNQRTFKAHRLVLASENSKFEQMINGSDKLEAIKIPDVHPKAFENLVRYCYGGDFLFKDLETIRETCLAAKKFKANELQQIAEDNLINLLKSESLIKVLGVCLELNLTRAKERCLEAISTRMEKVLRTEEFISAPFEIIEAILGLCPDRGLDLKMCAVCALIFWAERRGCPSIVFRRLLAKIQYGNFPSEVVLPCFKRNLIEFRFRLNDQVRPRIKDFLLECKAGNAAFKDTKAESSKVEKETSFEDEKVVKDEVEKTGLKDKREIGEIIVETHEEEDEKLSDASSDSVEDDGVIEEEVIKDIIKQSSDLIALNVTNSSRETVDRFIATIVELTNRVAENMQEAVFDMEESLRYLDPCNANTSENTEVSSS